MPPEVDLMTSSEQSNLSTRAVLKRLTRGSAAYGSADMLQKGIMLLLIPIYTRHMVPAESGVVGVATIIASIFSIVMGFGLRGAVVREYYDYRDDPDAIRSYLGTETIFALGTGSGLIRVR